jgi:VanZ family protein
MQSHRMRLFLHWIPAMIGIAVILCESTATMSAANTSRWLLPLWTRLFGPVSPERWGLIHHYLRKTGHFVGYGTVSLAFFDSWRVTLARRRPEWWPRFRSAAAMALLSTLLLASWDEWHQSLIPGRTSSPWDVALDFSGALIAHLLLLAAISLFRRRPAMRMQAA